LYHHFADGILGHQFLRLLGDNFRFRESLLVEQLVELLDLGGEFLFDADLRFLFAFDRVDDLSVPLLLREERFAYCDLVRVSS